MKKKYFETYWSIKQMPIEIKFTEMFDDSQVIQVWQSAKELSKFFSLNIEIVNKKRIIEFGSGSGFLGVVISKSHFTYLVMH